MDFFEGSNKVATDSSFPFTITATDVPAQLYAVVALAVTNTGDTLRSQTANINVTACQSRGSNYGEGYPNIPGPAVSALLFSSSYPGSPTFTANLPQFEYNNVGDNYGGRLRGYICAPQTGNYIFYIAGDDHAGLYLITNYNPANKVLIAYSEKNTGFRQWNAFSTQQSIPIRLIAGVRYYVETQHKENVGADHLSVGWRLPNGVFEGPIPGNRLSPFVNTPAS